MKPRKLYIVNKISSGSYNIIYSISTSKDKKEDKKIILRLSKVKESIASIKMELRGIKIQYKLSKKNSNIGLVIDYGRLISKNDNSHQEYSILEKYGVLKTEFEPLKDIRLKTKCDNAGPEGKGNLEMILVLLFLSILLLIISSVKPK